jgi:hypothetical protein
MARIQTVRVVVSPLHEKDLVSLVVMSSTTLSSGVSATGYIGRDEAEDLIKKLRAALDSWPREAEAGDLGLGE